jgi:hypothetical protein
MKELSMF